MDKHLGDTSRGYADHLLKTPPTVPPYQIIDAVSTLHGQAY